MSIKQKISRLNLYFSDLKPILLSHHPNCENFDKHVYHLGKYRLCIGCFTFYPMILITIIFTLLFIELNWYTSFLLYFISFIFFSPIILNILGLTKYKVLKIFSKVSTGIGVGLYIVSVLFLPVFFIFKILALIPINGFIGIISYIRTKHIVKECQLCKYKGDWNTCPAMKPITEKLYAHGFKVKN
ncbi:MAG: hypothetical protein ACFFAO_21045 [Candidatus Hermodarchaeota archaeon]